jgi:hypothetical protein
VKVFNIPRGVCIVFYEKLSVPESRSPTHVPVSRNICFRLVLGYEGPALKEFRQQLLYYGRFIDDTFAIIEGDLEAVRKFQKCFRELHPNMKMEWTQSRYQLLFLDVSI